MLRTVQSVALAAGLIHVLFLPCCATGQTIALDSTKGLQPHGVVVDTATYQGRKAIRVISAPESDAEWAARPSGTGGGIVILPGTSFHNGTIELELAGKP